MDLAEILDVRNCNTVTGSGMCRCMLNKRPEGGPPRTGTDKGRGRHTVWCDLL